MQFNKTAQCVKAITTQNLHCPVSLYPRKLSIKSYVETLQQNGSVQHRHKHFLNVRGALSFKQSFQKMFRSHVVHHALPHKSVLSHVLQNKSPYEHLARTLTDRSLDVAMSTKFDTLLQQLTLLPKMVI